MSSPFMTERSCPSRPSTQRSMLGQSMPRLSAHCELKIVEMAIRGQFHQLAYVQLLRAQIPKAQKDSQVISRNKVDQLVVLMYFSGFALKFDEIDPRYPRESEIHGNQDNLSLTVEFLYPIFPTEHPFFGTT